MARAKVKAPAPAPAAPARLDELALDIAFEQALMAQRRPSKPTTVVTSYGTNAIGRPVMMEPVSPTAILNNLVCRETLDPTGEPEPISETVTGLEQTVSAISRGTDITPFKDKIERITANRAEKSDVIRSYMNQIDHETIADLAIMEANARRVIKSASRRGDVTVSESLVVWRMANDQMSALRKGLTDDSKPIDASAVISKIDYHRQQHEIDAMKRWEGTTPQGRELIRKKLWRLQRTLLEEQKAKIPPEVEPPEDEPMEPPEDEEIGAAAGATG